uniref:Carbohydrate sulfotransferase 8 n=1 Tax=Mus musculus TaxID=10090 RepID=D6RCV4_MOUSE
MTPRLGTMRLACMFSSILLFGAAGLLLFISLQDPIELSPQQVPGIKFSIRPQQPQHVSSKNPINHRCEGGVFGEGEKDNSELMEDPFIGRKMCWVLFRSLGNKTWGFGFMSFPSLLDDSFGLY